MQVLASGETSSRDWLAARAGLLVLRHVDAWGSGEWLAVQLVPEREAVTTAVSELPVDDRMRGLLAAVLERTAPEWVRGPNGRPQSRPPAFSRVSAPLLAYAHALQFASEWALAADVYLTVWETCGPVALERGRESTDIDSATTAALRLGFCYRTLGDFGRSTAAYAAAGLLAQRHGDERTLLRSRLGEAKIIQELGNLPEADARMALVIHAATAGNLSEVRAHALHDRANVAYHRGRYRDAVEWGFEAWITERDPRERERVLADLAVALLAAGYRTLARDAHQMLAIAAQEVATRWLALINLIEIATLEGDEADFHRCRRALRNVPLPPGHAAGYHYYLGLGEIAFGRPVRARAELERAIALGEQYHLGEWVIKADAALASLSNGRPSAHPTPPAPLPPEHAYIEDALHGAWAATTARG